jgi:hypothetical protein
MPAFSVCQQNPIKVDLLSHEDHISVKLIDQSDLLEPLYRRYINTLVQSFWAIEKTVTHIEPTTLNTIKFLEKIATASETIVETVNKLYPTRPLEIIERNLKSLEQGLEAAEVIFTQVKNITDTLENNPSEPASKAQNSKKQ